MLLWFIEQRLEADPCLHLVAWCRFRVEAFRVLAAVKALCICGHKDHEHHTGDCNYVAFGKKCDCPAFKQQFECGLILGGQKRDERLRALALLKPETSPTGPVFVVGVEGTGSFGLDLCAAHTCVTISSGYSPGKSSQTLDRVYGPNQKHPIAYFSILATGPKGEHTIDHTIEEARRMGQDIAQWTAGAWIKALTEE